MSSASEGAEIHCPKCRAQLPQASKVEDDSALHQCKFCDTVVLRSKGDLKIAGRKHDSDEGVDWLHALCCRLCGGSISKTAAAEATKATVKCGYCGHTALLKPGIISVLRVLFRDPKLVPPALRRRALFAVSILLATIAMTAYMVVEESGSRLAHFTVDTSQVQEGDVVYDRVIAVPSFAKSLHVTRDITREHKGLHLDAYFVHQGSKSCLAYPSNSWSSFYMSSNGTIPSGDTRVFVRVASMRHVDVKGEKAKEARYDISSYHVLSLGYLIFALNIVIWLSIAIIKLGVDFQSTKRRGAQATQVLAMLFIAYWFCITVVQYNPFGPREFSPNDAKSDSKQGQACRDLPPN